VPRAEVWARVLELARWEAQQATLHCAQELWYHAACRDDPHAADLLRDWVSERVWTFLDLAEAIKSEGSARGWEQAEPLLPPADPPTPGGGRARFLGGQLRGALPSQARRHPFSEADWFARRATAGTIGAKVSRRKRAQGRTRSASGPSGGAVEGARGDSVDRAPEGDADSASEPDFEREPGMDPLDPLDPEPDFWRYPNQWRLWVLRQERRKAEREASVLSQPRGPDRAVQIKSMPIRPFKGADGDLDRFLMALEAHFRLQRIDDDLDRIYPAGMLLEGRPAKWFGTYLCKINPKEARRHKAKFVEDPTFKQWETFKNGLRESFGGTVDRNAAVDEWNRLRYQGSIDEFIDEISRL
jgi:hypothetical protein